MQSIDLPFRCTFTREFRPWWVNNHPPLVTVGFSPVSEFEHLPDARSFDMRLPLSLAEQFVVGEVYVFTVSARRLNK